MNDQEKQIIFEQNINNSAQLFNATVRWLTCCDKHRQWKQVLLTYDDQPSTQDS